jgi:hypothetical protein
MKAITAGFGYKLVAALAALLIGGVVGTARAESDPLPSWNDRAAKKSIVAFVAKVAPSASRRSTTTARSGANSRCRFSSTSRWTA